VQLRGIRHQSENIYNSIQTMITTDEKSMAWCLAKLWKPLCKFHVNVNNIRCAGKIFLEDILSPLIIWYYSPVYIHLSEVHHNILFSPLSFPDCLPTSVLVQVHTLNNHV
jgi:hypothetical protein